MTASYRRSFFEQGLVRLASARAGNVLGGGDWNEDRLIPDAARAFAAQETVEIRMPHATRPWQHVTEPLRGYLVLAQACHQSARFADAWNFGPQAEGMTTVGDVVSRFAQAWGSGAAWRDVSDADSGPHEAGLLGLDITKASTELGWVPRTDLASCLSWTADWYRAFYQGASQEQLRDLTLAQIDS